MNKRIKEFVKRQKQRCLSYCLKKGIPEKEAEKIAVEYEQTGLEFPL